MIATFKKGDSGPTGPAGASVELQMSDHWIQWREVGAGSWTNLFDLDTLITGGASSIVSANLTASRALVSDSSGKVAGSSVTSTELGYLSGVTSALQTQLNGKEPATSAGTTAQYWRGDKTWQTLNAAAVGLGNCDNTSDANKPVSTATQTALDGKEPTQTAASQAEAEAGTEAAIRKWSPVRIKQAIDALGGGGSITTPKVLHITTAGNDTTGDGSPGTPYATAQKAFDIAFAGTGNYVLMFGVGNFSTVLCPSGWPDRIAIAGVGLYMSAINSIQAETLASAGSNGQSVSIRGNGSIRVDDVSARGATGTTSNAGGNGGSITLWDVGYSAISVQGGDGGDESSPWAGDGGSGGSAGEITLHRCIDIGGGEKSALGGGGGPGGTPGTDGTITDLLGEHRVAGNWSGATRYAHLCLLNSGDSTAWSSADNTDTCSTY